MISVNKPDMKSIIPPLFVLAIILALFSSSCKKGGKCEEPINLSQSRVIVAFKDRVSGKYLYTEINPIYNKDSLQVLDANRNSLVILNRLRVEQNPPYIEYYSLSFGNIYNQQTDAASFNSEICKDYFVRYNYNQFDTIRACFKAKKTECGSVFETLKVFHKGQLLTTVNNRASASITLLKD